MKKIVRIEQSDDSPFVLTWVINTICTNRCSYCPTNLRDGSNHNYDWNNARQFLKQVIDRYKNITCTVTGGEPTQSPFLPELVDIIHTSGNTVTLSTNGNGTHEYWKELAPKLEWVGFSYHPEFSTQQYFENLKTASQLTTVDARIMMLSSHWDQCVEVYEQLRQDADHTTTAVRITNWLGPQNNGTDQYTDSQIEWFRNDAARPKKTRNRRSSSHKYSATRVHMDDGSVETIRDTSSYINNKQTVFTGYTCEIGLRSLYVSKYGDIRRGNCWEGDTIGNINRVNEIQWPTAPVTCNRDSCDCGTDVVINKWINQ